MKIYRGVEQLVARRAHNPEVVGSNPTAATKISAESHDSAEIFFDFQNFLATFTFAVFF